MCKPWAMKLALTEAGQAVAGQRRVVRGCLLLCAEPRARNRWCISLLALPRACGAWTASSAWSMGVPRSRRFTGLGVATPPSIPHQSRCNKPRSPALRIACTAPTPTHTAASSARQPAGPPRAAHPTYRPCHLLSLPAPAAAAAAQPAAPAATTGHAAGSASAAARAASRCWPPAPAHASCTAPASAGGSCSRPASRRVSRRAGRDLLSGAGRGGRRRCVPLPLPVLPSAHTCAARFPPPALQSARAASACRSCLIGAWPTNSFQRRLL